MSSVSSLTGERGFVGTIDYVTPEQIEGGTIDGRADVYSLGCVLYECLAGEKPFDRDSEQSVVFAHLNEPPPRITDVRPELPAAFDETVVPESLAFVSSMLDWSRRVTYDIDAPGRNHGLLTGTIGWSPDPC